MCVTAARQWPAAQPAMVSQQPAPVATIAASEPADIPIRQQDGRRNWADPSIDPRLLEKAYPRVARPLPAEARPTAPNIHPPSAKQRRVEHQVKRGDLLVY